MIQIYTEYIQTYIAQTDLKDLLELLRRFYRNWSSNDGVELLRRNTTQWNRSLLPVCLYSCLSTHLSVYLSVLPELTSGCCRWSCPWKSWSTCADWVFRCDWTASWNGLRHSEPRAVFCPFRIAAAASPQPPLAGNASDTPQSRPGPSAGQTCTNNQTVQLNGII